MYYSTVIQLTFKTEHSVFIAEAQKAYSIIYWHSFRNIATKNCTRLESFKKNFSTLPALPQVETLLKNYGCLVQSDLCKFVSTGSIRELTLWPHNKLDRKWNEHAGALKKTVWLSPKGKKKSNQRIQKHILDLHLEKDALSTSDMKTNFS